MVRAIDFLAGAGLADEQDAGLRRRHQAGQPIDFLHGRRTAHDAGKHAVAVPAVGAAGGIERGGRGSVLAMRASGLKTRIHRLWAGAYAAGLAKQGAYAPRSPMLGWAGSLSVAGGVLPRAARTPPGGPPTAGLRPGAGCPSPSG